jgi:ubiquinone/menaquinone biosynthesis C-methylase UbiE
MLPRVLESEVMDSPEEARDYDAMDHAVVNRTFVTDFLAVWNGRGQVLDVGTGTAQIPVQLCRSAPAVEVLGVDLAEHMLRLGRDNVRAAGLSARIRLERADAKRLPYPPATFGAVVSNSIVHHIPEPRLVLTEMVRVARGDGLLFVRDLLRPTSEEELRQLVETYAAGANPHQRQLFADSLRAALSLNEVRELVGQHLHADPATVKQTSDRHWTWTLHKKSAEC